MTKVTAKKSKAPLYISAGIVAIVILGYFLIPGIKSFFDNAWNVLTSDDEQRIKDWVSQFGPLGPIVIIFSMTLQMFLLVIPTPLLMVVSVLAYGPFMGGGIIFVAIFSASSIGYTIGAYFGPSIVTKILGNKTEQKVASFIKDYGFWAVIVTRLSPFLSNDAISFVGGLLHMGYWRFIGATLIGITPLTIFIAYLGENTKRLREGLLWGSIVSIVLFVLYVWWDKHRKKR